MKAALVCIAKNEKRYLSDWIRYHIRAGFDSVIVCDNEDPSNDEQKGIVENESGAVYEDCRGKEKYQNECYQRMYAKYNGDFDWMAFWDVDEFLQLEQDQTVGQFISRVSLQTGANLIFLNWKCFGDSGRVYYENAPMYDRFTVPYPKDLKDPTWPAHKINSHIKSIVKCIGGDIKFGVPHNAKFAKSPSIMVNAAGQKLASNAPWQNICWEGAWLNHYCTLTIDEFFSRRMNRGRATTTKKRTPQELCDQFFIYNKNTPEKMEVLKKYFQTVETK